MTQKYEFFTIYNFVKLYAGTADKVNTIIASDLEYDELVLAMKEEMLDIKDFEPALLITKEQEKPIIEFKRNEEKFKKRQELYGEMYGFTDGESESIHHELAIEVDFVELIMEEEKQRIDKLNEALLTLTDIQRQRIYMNFFKGMSIAIISKIEGKSWSTIKESLNSAYESMRKYILNEK